MTVLIADIASYQVGLTPTALLAAGFTGVNVKVSHGMGQAHVAADAHLWLGDVRFTHSTFHYLTGEASGATQAGYAYMRMVEMGGPASWAHAVDCEADATLGIYLEYVDTMALLLKRPIITYTGDWWWMPRGWTGAPASPWLWASPNAGYLKTYPGDDSASWTAGYGGWSELAAMQYSVAPIGQVAVSQTAIRSDTIWRMMRGELDPLPINSLPASTSLLAEIDALAPGRDRASDGTIGDTAHATEISDHNPDETGNTGSVSDPDAINEVHARDIDSSGPWPNGWLAENIVQIILAKARAGDPRPRYVIYNRRIWTRNNGWAQEVYAGTDPHTGHIHVSFMYGSGSSSSNPENVTTPWGILAAYEAEQDMDEAGVIAALNKWAGATPGYVNNIVPAPDTTAAKRSVVAAFRDARLAYEWSLNQVSPAIAAIKTEVDGLTVTVDVPSLAAAIAAALPPVTSGITPEQVEGALVNVLRSGVAAYTNP